MKWDYFKKTADMSNDVGKVVKSLEPEVVLNIGREVRPIMSALQTNRIAQALETGDASILDGKPAKKATPSPKRFNGCETSTPPGYERERASGPPTPNGVFSAREPGG